MSELYFRGSRRPGTKCLCRRHHDLGGTDYEYIASLPNEAVTALEHWGAEIRLRLRDDFEEGKAPWILDVRQGEKFLGGCYISDDAMNVLLAEPDKIRVAIEDEEITLAKRDLQIARVDLLEKQRLLEQAEEKVAHLEAHVEALSKDDPESTGPSL